MDQAGRRVIALAVVVILVVVVLILQTRIEQRRRDDARRLVEDVVARYPDGLKGDERETRDPWGRLLRVEREEGVFEGYVVASAGPDGRFATRDDITARKHVAVRADKAGEAFGKALGDFGVGAAKGLYKSARDHLRGK
jgi:hypothetical protein